MQSLSLPSMSNKPSGEQVAHSPHAAPHRIPSTIYGEGRKHDNWHFSFPNFRSAAALRPQWLPLLLLRREPQHVSYCVARVPDFGLVAQQHSGPWPLELKESELGAGGLDQAAEEVKEEGLLPLWAKIAISITLGVLLLLLIGGGAAAPEQPWLTKASPASSAYFSAGTASAGVISCSSGEFRLNAKMYFVVDSRCFSAT